MVQANRPATAASGRDGYTKTQIALHWAVLALVLVQLISHEAMERFWDRVERGEASGLPDDTMSTLHVVSGIAVFALMLLRIVLRLQIGAPRPPADLAPLLQRAAQASHAALYVLLVLLPITGGGAIFLGIGFAASIHGALVTALWALVVLHVLAALYHAFVRRDGVFRRMFVPR